MAVQPTTGEDTVLYTVDMETPEFLVIYNKFTGDLDIYALEHPNRTVAAGAASQAEYHAALESGAYNYSSTSGGLAWSPIEAEHSADGMVDTRIIAPGQGIHVGIIITKLIDQMLKPHGCGADFKNHPVMIERSFQNTMNWWVFEGYQPSSSGGWDGILEYCKMHD